MPEVTIQRAFHLAVEHQRAGRFNDAATIYGEILKAHPNHPDALHLFGVLMHQIGDDNNALQLISQAIEENPGVADYFCNLGSVLSTRDKVDDAIAAYRKAIALKPDYADAYRNLGTALLLKGQMEDAVDAFRWSLALEPRHPQTSCNLGRALVELGEYEEATDVCRQALALDPENPLARNYLGAALMGTGLFDEAAEEFRAVTNLRPEMPEGWGNLGTVFQKKRKFDEAVTYFRKAMKLRPDDPQWSMKLGEALHTQGNLEEAIGYIRKGLERDPRSTNGLIALGNALRDKGDQAGAMEQCRKVLEIDPENQVAHSNILFTVHADPAYDAMAILNEHRRWGEACAEPLKSQIKPHDNDRTAGRRLRIGYVSPDLYFHPVGKNIFPLLQAHDRKSFEIFCYAGVDRPDAMTEQIKGVIDCWRDVRALNDEKLAELIRRDRIDILLDLSMHTGGNRMMMFARKPAPVQVSYLGFYTTTGLDTMDYRISDPYIDPPGADLSCYIEQTCRLSRNYWCYNPENFDPVAPLPARSAGRITFASMNTYSKVTPQALDLWARVMLAAPGSSLLIHSKAGSHLPELRKRFERNGVAAERVEFVKRYSREHYYQVYNYIDICLDTFPYGGGITTCDSLWMGVPVVSLFGRTATSHAAASVLSNAGLPELIAKTPEEYMSIAAKLAADWDALAKLRAGLRDRMKQSPLLDWVGFARDMEGAYRGMWKKYCEEGRTAL